MVVVQEQKIIREIMQKKKLKLCHFTLYKFYLKITLGNDDHHFQYKCGNEPVYFHKFPATFPFEFYRFYLYLIFYVNRSGTTFAFRCPYKNKSYVKLGLRGVHENATCLAMRQSSNFYFEH